MVTRRDERQSKFFLSKQQMTNRKKTINPTTAKNLEKLFSSSKTEQNEQ